MGNRPFRNVFWPLSLIVPFTLIHRITYVNLVFPNSHYVRELSVFCRSRCCCVVRLPLSCSTLGYRRRQPNTAGLISGFAFPDSLSSLARTSSLTPFFRPSFSPTRAFPISQPRAPLSYLWSAFVPSPPSAIPPVRHSCSRFNLDFEQLTMRIPPFPDGWLRKKRGAPGKKKGSRLASIPPFT